MTDCDIDVEVVPPAVVDVVVTPPVVMDVTLAPPIVIDVEILPPLVIEVDIEPPPVIEVIFEHGIPVPGPPGPPSPGSLITVVAGMTLSGDRVVRAQPDGSVVYASNDDVDDAARVLLMTTSSVVAGDTVDVLITGRIAAAGWAWTDGPVFLGTNGTLTQTAPTLLGGAIFICTLGSPDGPGALLFNPTASILL